MGQPSSGHARALWDLACAQGELGCRVAIHTTSAWVDDPVADAGVPVRPRVRVFPVAGPASIGFSPAAERWASSPEAAGFPVLHQHGIWQAFSRVALRWRERLRRPTIVAPHGSLGPAGLSYSQWKKALARLAYEGRNLAGASCLHAVSAGELRQLRELGFRNPVAVLSNGVPEAWLSSVGDAARFRSAHGLPADARVLLYISRIHRKKGLLTLVEAFARSRPPRERWVLVVAGPSYDPPYLAAVEALVAEQGLSARVRLGGELRGAARRDAFAAAELMVLPSVDENFGLVVAEALGVGVPVITTRGAVAWEVVETERLGWWVDPDLASLEGALLSAARLSEAELAAMGARGRALVLRDHRWGPIAARTLELYAWLAGGAPRPEFVAAD